MADTRTEKTVAEELREAASRLRGTVNGTTPGPWRRHDTYLNAGGHTATVLTDRRNINDTELVAWLPSRSHEPWADHPCWANSRWIALVHPGLAEPLASWLKQTASDYEVEVNPRVSGRDRTQPFCDRCGLWLVQVCTDQELCSCWDDALAVARVVNGGASRTGVVAPGGDGPGSGPAKPLTSPGADQLPV